MLIANQKMGFIPNRGKRKCRPTRPSLITPPTLQPQPPPPPPSAPSPQLLFEDASSVANDAVSSIRTVAAFGAEEKVVQLYDDKCRMPIAAGMRKGHVSGVGLGFSQFVMFCSYAMAFWYGAQLVAEGHTTFGNVFKVGGRGLGV